MDAADRSSLPRPASSVVTRPDLPRSDTGLPALDDAYGLTLEAGLAEIPLELSGAIRAALDAQVRLLLAWNASINLTALRSPELIARGHLLDSLIAVPVLRRLVARDGGAAGLPRPSILDLGSGAGYPGLPLALALPARRAALVDSIAKKADFLQVAARAAVDALRAAGAEPPDVVALAERAEDLADEPEQREGWDLVVARAVGSVAEVAELGLPLTRLRGHVVAWKRDGGDGALQRETAQASRIVEATGGGPPRIVRLPAAARLGLAGHCLVIIEKRRSTPDRYPRSAGERRRGTLP